MKLLVKREQSDSISTQGQLFIDDIFECYTLEPPLRVRNGKMSPVCPGTYDLTIRWSDKFKRLMPHVENVPGHTGILIHWGNWAKDTEDCLLVGSTDGHDFIGHSVIEFDALFHKLSDAKDENGLVGTITYLEHTSD